MSKMVEAEDYNFSNKFTGLCPAWVNAPSTLQAAHEYHGRNCVVIHERKGGFRCCFIDERPPRTIHLPEETDIVPGWR